MADLERERLVSSILQGNFRPRLEAHIRERITTITRDSFRPASMRNHNRSAAQRLTNLTETRSLNPTARIL